MCSHLKPLFSGKEDGLSLYCSLSFELVCRRHSFVLTGISRLFPIDQTYGYDNYYRSLANNPFGSSPTPFLSIVHS